MISVTVRFGASNELTREVADNTTVGDILRNSTFQAALGFGANVQAVVDGAVQPDRTTLSNGDIITVETKANSKA